MQNLQKNVCHFFLLGELQKQVTESFSIQRTSSSEQAEVKLIFQSVWSQQKGRQYY